MEWGDAEAEAVELHRRARLHPEDAPGAPAVAMAILGADAVRVSGTWSLPGPAKLVTVPRLLILVRPRLTPEALNLAVGHELGEWTLADYCRHDREHLADHLAVCIAAPACAVREAFQRHGWRLGRLARLFCLPQSTMALRVGEAVGISVALVTADAVIRRGDDLPGDPFLRSLARRGGDRRYPYRVLRVTGPSGGRLVVKTG